MVEAMLMVQRRASTKVEGMGWRSFAVLPRVGEGIELDIEGQGTIFRVVAVHHPGELTTTAGDIFAREEGPTTQVIKRLFDPKP